LKETDMHKQNDFGRPLAALLLGGLASVSGAATYEVREIAPEEAGSFSYTVPGGDRYLNDSGQVAGILREYSADRIYNTGPRAFVWTQGRVELIRTFGADALGYAAGEPSAINEHGHVGGFSRAFVKGVDHGPRGFIQADGRLHKLERRDLVDTRVVAINGVGSAAVSGLYYERGVDKGERALLWSGGKLVDLGTLGTDADGGGFSTPVALNDHNQVAGWSEYYDPQGQWLGARTVLWEGGVVRDLGSLGTDQEGWGYSYATDLNQAGRVVGSSRYFDGDSGEFLCDHAVLWKDGTIKDLGTLGSNPWACSSALAINAADQIIGYGTSFDEEGNWRGVHAILWEGDAIKDLGTFGVDEWEESYSMPNGLNDAGEIVGFSTYSENGVAMGNRAFIYRDGVMTDLNTLVPPEAGLLLENALAVNNRGQITAYGARTAGENSYKGYWLLTPRE
jgi:probable HAF family extracellular repeat protein